MTRHHAHSLAPRLVLCAAGLTLGAVSAPSLAHGPASVTEDGMTWPQWRGPTRDGHCTGPTWPDTLAPEHLKPVWRVGDLGPSYSGPIVTTDRVFTTETRDEKEEIVRAFDRETGDELWQTTWNGAIEVPFFAARNGSWIRSTPVADGDHLYVGGMEDVVVCLDAGTGDVVWTCDFEERLSTPEPSFGLVCSPLVVGDALFVQGGGSLVRLDKRTGDILWRSIEDGGGMNSAFSSPVLATIHGRAQLVVLTRLAMCGVDPESGAVLWSQPIASFRGMNILTPVVHDDAVFTAPYGGRAQLLRIAPTQETYEVTQAWNLRLQGYMTSPVVIDHHAYFFTRSNRFTCVDLRDGAEAWTSGPTGDSYWSLVAQGDRILALSDSGILRLIRATPELFAVIDEVSVSEDQTWAHVAVAGGRVFVREQSGLRALRWE